MQISKTIFYSVLLVFLLIPILAQTDLLLFGVKTKGTVTGSQWISSKSIRSGSRSNYAVIQFKTANQVIAFYGPQNVEYKTGEEVEILYDKNNPGNYLLLNFWGIYLSTSAILSALLLILWI